MSTTTSDRLAATCGFCGTRDEHTDECAESRETFSNERPLHTEAVTHAGYTAQAVGYGYLHEVREWRIDLAENGIGYGTLVGATLEGIALVFIDFIVEAMADLEAAAADQYDFTLTDGYYYEDEFEYEREDWR